MPDNEEDAVLSFAFSDHYLDASKLAEVAKSIKEGVKLRLSEQYAILQPHAQEYLRKSGELARQKNASAGISQSQSAVPADDEIERYLVKMLSDMRNEFTFRDLENPTIRRLYHFTGRYVEFVVNGGTEVLASYRQMMPPARSEICEVSTIPTRQTDYAALQPGETLRRLTGQSRGGNAGLARPLVWKRDAAICQ
jgi:urease gamma subunit